MALSLFYSYSHKDAALRDRLQNHLALLVRNGQIEPWHDRCIAPGDEWRDQIDEHLRSANVILLLISSDFLASDYCYGIEMKLALERHASKQAIVIPIILRPVDWAASSFSHLQALPADAKAVTLWPDIDEAFAHVAQAVRDVVVRYQQPTAAPLPPSPFSERDTTKARMLDAAMPSHIVKGRATELLVLIRLPESAGLAGVLQADDEAEAKPEDVRSKPFEVNFPIGPSGRLQPLKVSVQLSAPDFAVPVERKNLYVPVDRDSEVCPFMLTPLRTGPLLVAIELIWEDADRGYRRLKTNCVAEAEAAVNPVMNVVQMPVLTAAPAPPPPVRASAAPRQPAPAASFSSSPYVRAAAALCLLTLGGTFFVFQRAGSPVHTASGTATPMPVQSANTSQQIEVAAVEFKRISHELDGAKVAAEPAAPQVTAEMKTAQENLVLARAALAKGQTAQAKKHLELVRTANKNLTAHLAVRTIR